jgi:hypothetical protein
MSRVLGGSVLRALSVLSFGHFCHVEVLIDFVLQSARMVATVQAIDPFLSEMKAAAPFAAENGEPTVFPGAPGRSVPDFQADAVLLGVASSVVENFAAGGVGASENQLGHRHRESALSLIRSRKKALVDTLHGQNEWSSFL